jgi:hypothetical protein
MKAITIILSASALSILAFYSCKNQEKTTSEQPVEKKEAKGGEVISNDSDSNGDEKICRLVMSFISIGEGPDFQAKEKFENFVDSWNTSTGKNITYTTRAWGREGEVDYCFILNELTEKEQVQFIDEAKKAVSDSELVRIAENSASYYEK